MCCASFDPLSSKSSIKFVVKSEIIPIFLEPKSARNIRVTSRTTYSMFVEWDCPVDTIVDEYLLVYSALDGYLMVIPNNERNM